MVGAKDKGESADGFSYNEDYSDDVKAFELGLPVGVGYNINEHISVGVRGIWGLTNNNDFGDGYKDHNYMVIGVVRYNIGSLFQE